MARNRPLIRIALTVAVAVTLVAGAARASVPVTVAIGELESIGAQAPAPTVAPSSVEHGTPQLLPPAQVPGSSIVTDTFVDAYDAAPAHSGPAPPCSSARRQLLCTYRL